MRALVTGGAGFIGSHIVGRLLSNGHDVRVLDNLATGRRSNLEAFEDDFDWIEADIRDPAALAAACADVDVVFHLAALGSVPRSVADPAATHETNATGTLNVMIAARDADVRRVVMASSSSIYGSNRELPKRESMTPLPISPYAVSKLAGESYARSFHQVYGLETVVLRYFNVFGPRQDPNSEYAAMIPKFVMAFRHNDPPTIFGDGEQSRDFTYVENVVDANMLAASAPDVGGNVYNIACGTRITLNEIAQQLRAAVGATTEIKYGPERPGDVKHSLADISAARRDLGYEPGVDLTEGVRRTVEYFAEEEDFKSAASADTNHVLAEVAAVKPTVTALNGSRPHVGPKHVFITGGAGFIGSHLTEAMLAANPDQEIVILDDLSTGSMSNIELVRRQGNVRFVRGSATDADLVDDLMANASRCIHLASAVGVQMIVNEPLETLMRSVRGSNVVMHSAANYEVPVLFSSTSEVYGKQSHNSLTEQDDLVFGSPEKGRWTYAIAKTFGEALISGYHRQRGANATVVRLFNTVGPRQTGLYGMVLPRFVRQALQGQQLTVYGDGSQTRCFTHVRDTVAGLMALCAEPAANGNTYNIGSTTPVAILDLAQRVLDRVGGPSEVKLVPYREAYSSGFEELGSRRPDVSALASLTGWHTRLTLDDAIDDVIACEREQMLDVSLHPATPESMI